MNTHQFLLLLVMFPAFYYLTRDYFSYAITMGNGETLKVAGYIRNPEHSRSMLKKMVKNAIAHSGSHYDHDIIMTHLAPFGDFDIFFFCEGTDSEDFIPDLQLNSSWQAYKKLPIAYF